LRSITVTGTGDTGPSGEVTANLALSFALSGRDVALVDLVPPSATEHLHVRPRTRHIERAGGVVLDLATVPAGRGAVHVLMSREPTLDRGGGSPNGVVRTLLQLVDLVVVHAPPLLLEPGTVLVARQTTGVVVVDIDADPSATELVQALDILEESNAPVLGAVLAHAPGHRGRRRIPVTTLDARPPMHPEPEHRTT
jgi:Mrp family chromosome partitioning ATPase